MADESPLLANADVLDAALCCLAGADFLLGQATSPINPTLARKEGWIWVRESSGSRLSETH